MRIKLALVATIAALGSMLAAPAAAHAAPDSSACSAPGTYSYLYGNTFVLIGSVGNYRYWEVANGANHYQRSYVVKCSGATIVSSTDLTSFSSRCDTTSTYQFQYVGEHRSIHADLIFPTAFDHRYWHVNRWVQFGFYGFWVFDHSEVALCDVP